MTFLFILAEAFKIKVWYYNSITTLEKSDMNPMINN